MYTILETAKLLGLSKNTVKYRMRKLLSEDQMTEEDGKIYITETGFELLKNQAETAKETGGTEQKSVETSSETVEELIKELQNQLRTKDNQIEKLQEQLDEERRHSREQAQKLVTLADQAQKLQLAQMTPAQLPEPQEPEVKRRWWERLLG